MRAYRSWPSMEWECASVKERDPTAQPPPSLLFTSLSFEETAFWNGPEQNAESSDPVGTFLGLGYLSQLVSGMGLTETWVKMPGAEIVRAQEGKGSVLRSAEAGG